MANNVYELRKQTKWHGVHRGVHYEVVHWGESYMNNGAGVWNYYILIPEPQLPPEDWEKVWLDPMDWVGSSSGTETPIYDAPNSILGHGDFHGGITFYEKEQVMDSRPSQRLIRVGCDYNHITDSELGYPYSLSDVASDAQNTIDNLCEVLRFKARCPWNGSYFNPEEGIKDEKFGGLLSPSGWEHKRARDQLMRAE